VRNETFKKAADNIQGPARKIFIEFLERSCTAEFSGFLLYKELGRRLKKTNPVGTLLLFWAFLTENVCFSVNVLNWDWHVILFHLSESKDVQIVIRWRVSSVKAFGKSGRRF
jgi:hypothetical protein